MPDIPLSKTPSQRADKVLSLLFRSDGKALKQSNVDELLAALWFNRHNAPANQDQSREELAGCLLDCLAQSLKQDLKNAACRKAAAQAATEAAAAIDQKDFSEEADLLEASKTDG